MRVISDVRIVSDALFVAGSDGGINRSINRLARLRRGNLGELGFILNRFRNG